MGKIIGFGGEEDDISTELEKYTGMYVSINARGGTHIGKLSKVERDHLSLLPVLIYEGFPGKEPVLRYRIEKNIPARIELPVDCVYPIRKKYLDEIVEHTKRELKKQEEAEKKNGK